MTAGRPRGPISAASWALSGWRAEQGGDEFASAADAEFVEYGAEVFLNRVGGDVQLFDDLLGRTALQDEGSNALWAGVSPWASRYSDAICIGRALSTTTAVCRLVGPPSRLT